jgi:malate dehydrogenase (oxaloacetate-decarboxylating)
VRVATRVLQQAFDDGVARTTKTHRDYAEAYVRAKFWRPKYLPLERA